MAVVRDQGPFSRTERCERVCKPRARRQQQRRNWPFTETLRGRKGVAWVGSGKGCMDSIKIHFLPCSVMVTDVMMGLGHCKFSKELFNPE